MKTFILDDDFAPPLEDVKIDYVGALNPTQLSAVTHRKGPLLIIAGAGSGKTRTLVYRVAYLVKLGIAPESILLLTFTRKAAEEMLSRAATLMDHRCERVSGGTFHSFANQCLRRYADLIGFSRSFTIMDRPDAEDVINLLRAERALDTKERRFPRKATLAEMFGKAVNRNMTVKEVVKREFPQFVSDTSDIVNLFAAYEVYKREKDLMDYDDLLVYFRNLLASHPEISEEIGLRYHYIMIDEFQDTNFLQGEIAAYLAKEHQNLVVVGDDAQSIYRFRGATVQNILNFPKQFQGTKIVKLEENYRSVQPILDVANAVLKHAKHQYEKKLFTQRKGGDKPVLVPAQSENEQSRFVAREILRLREEGVALNEIAVLFRSSYLAYDLELTLGKYGIPYVKYGGFKFIEAAHVKDVLAYLRMIENPLDAISANRVLLLLEGVGPKASLDILHWMANAADPFDFSTYKAKPKYAKSLLELGQILQKIRDASVSLAEKIEWVMEHYTPLVKQKYDDYPKRLRDLEQMKVITERFSTLEGLLSEMVLDPPTKSIGDILSTQPDEGNVILSTIHSSKGLEWHSVFLIWALDGRFPSAMSLDEEEDIEEERRLFYVAVTRAKDNLYISYPTMIYDRVMERFLTKPSRFLDHVPANLLERARISSGKQR